jgi:hypothetical protein
VKGLARWHTLIAPRSPGGPPLGEWEGANMKFQVGKYICEISLDGDGKAQTRWFLGNGRKIEPPTYLDRIERVQYQAGLSAFREDCVGPGSISE